MPRARWLFPILGIGLALFTLGRASSSDDSEQILSELDQVLRVEFELRDGVALHNVWIGAAIRIRPQCCGK